MYILYICRPKCLPNVLSPNHVAQVPVAQTSCRLNVCRPNVCTQFYRTDLWQTHSSTRLRLTHWSIGSDGVRKNIRLCGLGQVGFITQTSLFAIANSRVYRMSWLLVMSSKKRSQTFRPSQLTWAVIPSVGCCRLRSPLPFINIINQLILITAQRVCIARIMPSQDVCPSVCPSVTRRYSVDTAEHILKIFYHQVASRYCSGILVWAARSSVN